MSETAPGHDASTDRAMSVDLEVFRYLLVQIPEEMVVNILNASRSVGATDVMDFSTGLFDSRARLIAQGLTSPIHLGALPTAIHEVIGRYGDDFRPGDIYVLNDPFSGGMHLPDILMFHPVFHDGQIVGYSAVLMHHADIGGRVPGGNAADSTEIFQEGLRLPPVPLVRAGERVQPVWDIVAANVRVPDTVLADLDAKIAGCLKAGDQLRQVVAERGVAEYDRSCDELIEYSRRMAVQEIRGLPAGSYEFTDHIDDDGMTDDPIRIRAVVTVDHDEGFVDVDLTDCSPQSRGAINPSIALVRSCAYLTVRAVCLGDVPVNQGFLERVRVRTREGTIMQPRFPAACAARGVTAFRLIDTLLGALAQAAPERVPAAGEGGCTIITVGGYHDGEPFIYFEVMSGSWGGRPGLDGIDGITNPGLNMQNTPVEVIERNYPIHLNEYGFVPDTGGAGEYRGGLSLVKDFTYTGEEPAILQIRADRVRFRPYGLFGGEPGAPARILLCPRGEDAWQTLGGKITREIQPGDRLRVVTAGGGGWGDPEARDAARRVADVADDKVVPEPGAGGQQPPTGAPAAAGR